MSTLSLKKLTPRLDDAISHLAETFTNLTVADTPDEPMDEDLRWDSMAGIDWDTAPSYPDSWTLPHSDDLPKLQPKKTRHTEALRKGRCEHGLRFYHASTECYACLDLDRRFPLEPETINMVQEISEPDDHQGAATILLNADIEGQKVRCLLDSGANNTYLSESLVKKIGLRRTPLGHQRKVKVADGFAHIIQDHCPNLPIRFDSFSDEIHPLIIPLRGTEVILGMNWLKRHNPTIDWSTGQITFRATTSPKA